MSTLAGDIEELRKALSLGPTPGPWARNTPQTHGTSVDGPLGVSLAWFGTAGTYGINGSYSITWKEAAATAAWIVAANPERILRLLDHLESSLEPKP